MKEWRNTYNSQRPYSSSRVADAPRLRRRLEDLRQAHSQGEWTDERGPVVKAGERSGLWLIEEGGRKGGDAYYTPEYDASVNLDVDDANARLDTRSA